MNESEPKPFCPYCNSFNVKFTDLNQLGWECFSCNGSFYRPFYVRLPGVS
jgi:transposase-like protein